MNAVQRRAHALILFGALLPSCLIANPILGSARPPVLPRVAGLPMKTILCYGDSNTYGYNPADGSRFDHHTRWPGVLRDRLGAEFWVVEEGCNGRTTVCFTISEH